MTSPLFTASSILTGVPPSRTEIVVGISDMRISKDPNSVLATHALGSCVGVMVHAPRLGIGGLLHFMLPTGDANTNRPAMYGDTGVALMMKSLERMGVKPQDLVVKIAGGGVFNDPKGFFLVGERNVQSALDALLDYRLIPGVKDVGGHKSRTVRLEVATGAIVVRSRGEEYRL